ncbi:MAG: polyprenol monophosphomannose synthase [Pirellulaceae bacterium]
MPQNELSSARVLVLLCTYNEVDNLPTAVERLHVALPQADVLVVDDNSPDGTGRWLREQVKTDRQLFHLPRDSKQGLGTALQAGIAWCLERPYDFVINLDADLSHNPSDSPSLLSACSEPTCDVAIGSRYIAGGGTAGLKWHRRWLSRALNAYATRLLRLPLTDCSGSFRCYRTNILRKISLERLTCSGYGFLEEILVHLQRAGARFCEVPIEFEMRGSGASKLGLSDAIGALRVIHQLALGRKK